MRGPKPCWPEDDRYADVKRQISLFMGQMHRSFMKQQVPDGLTRVETMVIIALNDLLGEGLTVHPGVLARAARSTPSALSQTLKSLEGKGLILRERGKGDDCRSVSVELTEKGRAMVAEGQRMRNEDMSALLDYLGEGDVTELLRILGRIDEFRNGANAGRGRA